MKEPSLQEFTLLEKDLDISTTKGSGNGGQHRNKVETCVVITHKPTKTTVRCEDGRSQFQNKETAKRLLRAVLYKQQQERNSRERDILRKVQIGSGQRGNKRRTVRVQHGIVEDHISGKIWRYKDYISGNWE